MRITVDTKEELTPMEISILCKILAPYVGAATPPHESTAAEKDTSSPATDIATESAQDEEPYDGPSIDEAVEKATALMKSGKRSKVTDALKAAGVERVSHLKGKEQITAFVAALDAE